MPRPGRPALQAVLFDWGGVFSMRPPSSARRSLERRLGLEPGGLGAFFKEEDWLLLSTGRQTEAEFWARVCEGFPRRPDPALARLLWAHLFSNTRVRRELVLLLAVLRGRVKLGLLSNAGPSLRSLAAPLLPMFDDVVISAEVGLRKPDSEIFGLALRRLGCQPAGALLVDDFAHNVEAARQLGIRGHRFTTPGRLRAALERQGVLQDTDRLLMTANGSQL